MGLIKYIFGGSRITSSVNDTEDSGKNIKIYFHAFGGIEVLFIFFPKPKF